jgi:hypothetical protein
VPDRIFDSNPELRALWEIEQQKYRETRPNGGNSAAIIGYTNFSAQAVVTLDDFYAFMPMHNYIFTPCRDIWVAGSVNARIPSIPLVDAYGAPVLDDKGKQKNLSATSWLDQNN